MKVCVIGTGYVGLVTGACLADFGNEVSCVDIDRKKIANLKNGVVDFFELGLRELILKNVAANRLFFTHELAKSITSASVVFITVGTPPLPNGEADLSAIIEVSRKVANILKSKRSDFRVVVVKSTVPVGTSEMVEKLMIKAGLSRKNFEVVSNPEFLREGKAVFDFLHPDRVVIGSSHNRSSNIMSELYRPLNARVIFMDSRSSELVKYASNVFLATRVSFINEIANVCECVGADIRRVAEGMGHDHRIGHDYLKAGLGYGGSCLPKDISALVNMAQKHDYETKLIKNVAAVNQAQRERFVLKIKNILGGVKGKKIAIWGLAFKPLTDDLRDAPALYIIEKLMAEGAVLRLYDPMASGKVKKIFPELIYGRSSYDAAKDCDAVIIVTEWNEFREVDFKKLKQMMNRPVIIDGRNVFDPKLLQSAGFNYYGIGVG
ncbi:MAG: UDP-glucose/GDP-mannose dehydrogenase family protein [Candidatus Margulisiibacteriota bacterium]